MSHFFQSHTFLFLALASTIGFLIGCIVYELALWLPQALLKNWRIQSWQCLYPHSEAPTNITEAKTTALQKKNLWHCLGLASCSGLLSLCIADHFQFCWATLANLILIWGLLTLAFIDFKHYLLPDCLTLPLLWLGLFCNTFNLFVPINTAIWGAIVGYISLWIVAKLFKYLRGVDGMGQGDFKLLALFGAWWGFAPLPAILLIASSSGAFMGFLQIMRGRHNLQKPLAFGPYLILSALVLFFILPTTNQ